MKKLFIVAVICILSLGNSGIQAEQIFQPLFDTQETIKYTIFESRLGSCVSDCEKEFNIPLALADTILYAKNPYTNEFMTFTEYQNFPNLNENITYSGMSEKEFQKLLAKEFHDRKK